MDLSGVLDTINGERALTLPSFQSTTSPGPPNPLFMLSRNLGGGRLNDWTDGVTGGKGLNNIGLLVTIAGRVTDAGSGFFIINGSVKVDSARLTDIPDEESFAIVTGICGTEQLGSDILPLIKPRRNADLTTYP